MHNSIFWLDVTNIMQPSRGFTQQRRPDNVQTFGVFALIYLCRMNRPFYVGGIFRLAFSFDGRGIIMHLLKIMMMMNLYTLGISGGVDD